MVFNVESKIPEVKSQDWRLSVSGQVNTPLALSLDELKNNFRQKSIKANILCLRGATIGGVWQGVPLKQLLEQARAKSGEGWVKVKAYSDYTEPVKLQDCRRDEVIVAFALDGKPVPPKQGGPLRLIMPEKYAYKSVKWVKEFEVLSKRPVGFWEKKGYPYKDDT